MVALSVVALSVVASFAVELDFFHVPDLAPTSNSHFRFVFGSTIPAVLQESPALIDTPGFAVEVLVLFEFDVDFDGALVGVETFGTTLIFGLIATCG